MDSQTPGNWDNIQKRFVGVTSEFRKVTDLKNHLLTKICKEDKVNKACARHRSYLATMVVSVWLLMVIPP